MIYYESNANPILTRRASLLALTLTPGTVGAGLLSMPALADDHEELVATLHDFTPSAWASLYTEPSHIMAFDNAYRSPSANNIEQLVGVYCDATLSRDEQGILIRFSRDLFDRGQEFLNEISVGAVELGHAFISTNEGINTAIDAVWVIVSGALDAVQSEGWANDLDAMRIWLARHVIRAIEGVVTAGSLLQLLGRTGHPLLLATAALTSAYLMTIENHP